MRRALVLLGMLVVEGCGGKTSGPPRVTPADAAAEAGAGAGTEAAAGADSGDADASAFGDSAAAVDSGAEGSRRVRGPAE